MKRYQLSRVGFRGIEALAIASAISGIIKGLAGRSRPFLTPGEPWNWDFNHGWSDARYFSMPSGHTTATVAFAVAVTIATRDWKPGIRAALVVPLLASALLVGAARIHTNQHWLTDIVVAMVLGTVTSLALAMIHARRAVSRYDRITLGDAAIAPPPQAAK
jgi:membrane-associated phospholipid phosphatase